jgi:hypothetical protein
VSPWKKRKSILTASIFTAIVSIAGDAGFQRKAVASFATLNANSSPGGDSAFHFCHKALNNGLLVCQKIEESRFSSQIQRSSGCS